MLSQVLKAFDKTTLLNSLGMLGWHSENQAIYTTQQN